MKNFTILVALSDHDLNCDIKQRLDQYYTVHTADDADDVTDSIHELQPNLAILDYGLAQMNPIEIDEGVNYLHPDTKIVLCVTNENLEVSKRIWHKRAIDYMRKPVDPNRFEDDVNKIVRHLLDEQYRKQLKQNLADVKNENQRLKNLL